MKYAQRHQIEYVKLSVYKCAHFLSFWLLSTFLIFHFHCYFISILPLYLSFHLDSLHCHTDSPHFSHFHPDFEYFHANSLHPHSHLIPCIPTFILRISIIPFLNFPFWVLNIQITCSVCNF